MGVPVNGHPLVMFKLLVYLTAQDPSPPLDMFKLVELEPHFTGPWPIPLYRTLAQNLSSVLYRVLPTPPPPPGHVQTYSLLELTLHGPAPPPYKASAHPLLQSPDSIPPHCTVFCPPPPRTCSRLYQPELHCTGLQSSTTYVQTCSL